MRAIGQYFGVLFRARTWREFAYLLVGLPIAILWFTYVITMYAVGLSLLIVWVGVLILVFTQWSLRPIGHGERKMANALAGARIVDPGPRDYTLHSKGGDLTWSSMGRWAHGLLHDGESWRVLGWICVRIVLGPVGFALAITAVVVPLALVSSWLIAIGYVAGIIPGPSMDPDDALAREIVTRVTFWVLVGTPAVWAAIPVFPWVSHHYTVFMGWLGRWGLGPCEKSQVAAATQRAELAETQVRVDQELHDSIGHMITMNIVQAGAGAHVFDSDPEFARQALRNIEQRGRVAMGELDRIIAAIRGDDAETRRPLPTLDDLPGLVDASRAAGLRVEDRLEAASAPPALSRAAFAIVRESVTNAAKHAPGATVHIHTRSEPDALGLSVTNGPPQPGATPLVSSHDHAATIRRGIAGIRDRAALLGGVSRAGATDDGGWEVTVLLPLELSFGADALADPPCCQWAELRAKVDA